MRSAAKKHDSSHLSLFLPSTHVIVALTPPPTPHPAQTRTPQLLRPQQRPPQPQRRRQDRILSLHAGRRLLRGHQNHGPAAAAVYGAAEAGGSVHRARGERTPLSTAEPSASAYPSVQLSSSPHPTHRAPPTAPTAPQYTGPRHPPPNSTINPKCNLPWEAPFAPGYRGGEGTLRLTQCNWYLPQGPGVPAIQRCGRSVGRLLGWLVGLRLVASNCIPQRQTYRPTHSLPTHQPTNRPTDQPTTHPTRFLWQVQYLVSQGFYVILAFSSNRDDEPNVSSPQLFT